VLETGLGAPDPEELAQLAAEEERALQGEQGKLCLLLRSSSTTFSV